jgi:hypothetical protein
MLSESLKTVLRVVDVLEELSIPYHLGGSFASSMHGVPRQTRDADLVVDLEPRRIRALVSQLEPDFYVEAAMIRDALLHRGSFNIVDLGTGFKVDFFLHGSEPFDRSEFRRHHLFRISDDPPRDVYVKSAEDTLLRKLEWYQLGGGISDRQWSDVLGILRVQKESLDFDYLHYWAGELGVSELLERALGSRIPRS